MDKRDNKKKGGWAEDAAVHYLVNTGYRIITRNYEKRSGEIDIIAEQDGAIVFVEVKYRTSRKYGTPSQAVNHSKQVHIVNTAKLFLQENTGFERECRFDVIEITGRKNDAHLHHIKNAFQVDRFY